MPKLHQLLAVEGPLKGQATKVRTELKATFSSKRHLFGSKLVTFTPLAEGASPKTEEQLEIQTDVPKELAWISNILAKALDASYNIAEANTAARADVVLDDDMQTVLLQGVPATALLELEKRCSEIKELAEAIPTLDPAKGFKPDPDKGAGIYRAREEVRDRTKKVKKILVKYPATKEHPAQTEVYDADEVIGTLRTQEWSGLLTPASKAAILERVETLQRAVKSARAKANEAEIALDKKIGEALLKYIFEG